MHLLCRFMMFAGWYLVMAVGGCASCGLLGCLNQLLYGSIIGKSEAGPLIFICEMTAAVFSGILLAGRLYLRHFQVDTEAGLKRTLGWRIHLFHGLTLIAIVADAFQRFQAGGSGN